MAETVVLTYGTFDLFHVGHVALLRRARALGTRLIVGVSSDEFNLGKGKRCVMSYAQRKEIVESVRYVDLVLPETSWAQKVEDIRAHNVDVFVMGDDWRGKFDDLKAHCRVVYLDRTPDISTTDLKAQLRLFDRHRVGEVIAALQAASDMAQALYGDAGAAPSTPPA